MLSTEAVAEFKKVYFEQFGIELNDAAATEMASSLLNLYRAVYSESNMTMKGSMNDERRKRHHPREFCKEAS